MVRLRRTSRPGAPILLALLAIASLLHPSPCRSWTIEIPRVDAVSAILLEPATGQVLYEQGADLRRAPASIAKLMLELVVLEKIQSGELTLADSVRVSAWASKIGGSQVYLREGEVFSLEDLLRAIVIHSANDACVAVAEHVAGSAAGFVDLMNLRAREMGLADTRYINVHGLDDEPGEGNVTTARDIAKIGALLVAMPHVLEWSSIEEMPFRDGEFLLQNTNKLLGRFPGLDGLKTGYTRKAGFCLCATAERKGMRLVSVVLGAESNRARFDETARLLSAGFNQATKVTVLAEGDPVPGGVPISGGRKLTLPVMAGAPVYALLPRKAEAPKPFLIAKRGLKAPVAKGDSIGTIELRLADGEVIRAPALAAVEMKKATIFDLIGRLFGGGRS